MPRYVIDGDWNGMVSPGNIDLDSRPVVKMPNGEYATVRSASFTMPDGYDTYCQQSRKTEGLYGGLPTLSTTIARLGNI